MADLANSDADIAGLHETCQIDQEQTGLQMDNGIKLSIPVIVSNDDCTEDNGNDLSQKLVQDRCQRDSGFHTMTRYEDTPSNHETNGIHSQTASSSPDERLKVSSSDVFPIQCQRSSRVISSKFTAKKLQEKNERDASKLADKLFNNLEGKDKINVVQHLSKKDDFSCLVLKMYMQLFNFTGLSLDESLRMLLKRLALLGETQERERVLYQFASRFQQCNPQFVSGHVDTIHMLVCAVMLLNTDLHRPKAGYRQKMTSKQFVDNLERVVGENRSIPQSLLKNMYCSIKKTPLPWCEVTQLSRSATLSKSSRMASKQVKGKSYSTVTRSQSMKYGNTHLLPTLHEDIDRMRLGASRSSKSKTLPRKQGVLWRKPIIESNGSRTAKRKRKWKLMAGALEGLQLHLAKKDSVNSFVISLHHSLAEVEGLNGSTKRERVFRITLANRAAALYQASSIDDVEAWVRAINRNAALLSTAPLPAGVGSQVKFQHPLLPSSCSTLPLTEQVEEQRIRLLTLRIELDQHEKTSPQESVTVLERQYYLDKEAYLRHEVAKYEIYTHALSELQHIDCTLAVFNHEKDPDKPDTLSLLSVSPSEPGSLAFPSFATTSASGGQELMVGPSQQLSSDHPRQTALTLSPLTSTSSLPNLLTLKVGELYVPSRPLQLPSSVPSTIQTDTAPPASGHASVVLTDTQSNNNNSLYSSSSCMADQKSDPLPVRCSHSQATGGKTSDGDPNKQASDQQRMAPHQADDLTCSVSPLVVSTSYLSSSRVVDDSCSRVVESKLDDGSSVRRVKGRKERRGVARHSYLQAVYQPTKD